MLTESLKQLGLTQGEAKVYEVLVSLGPSTVGPIVKRSGIAYSNIYEVLQRLTEKGLATHIIREKTKVFSVVAPHRLHEYLERQEEEIAKSRLVLAKVLPALTRLQSVGTQHTEAEVFVGMSGLRTAYDLLYDDVTRGEEAIYFYEHNSSYAAHAMKFYQCEWPRMRRRGIKARGIVNAQFKKTSVGKRLPSILVERYVTFPLPGNIDIVKDWILITAWSEKPVGVLIHSEQVAQNFRKYFDVVWKLAKQ